MSDNTASATADPSGSPAEFLKNVVGKQVKVRIGGGIDYEGELVCPGLALRPNRFRTLLALIPFLPLHCPATPFLASRQATSRASTAT